MTLKAIVLTMTSVIFSLGITGCDQYIAKTTNTSNINQDSVCEVKDWSLDSTLQVCKPGQKVVFLPSSFGNEQLPIIFSAVNCDLRYSVALTNGGVTCIYNPIKPQKQPDNSAKK